ncbi:uncharacterized protein B4U80_00218 [Leptotrombidium deliense]|uniref:Uncharacterized protein n=1 Tax=Leptotrombidium deliense TaxID=299467 RepID=A0A443SAL3_9ACAR|nr:uncharacterized protein B4U80_00218 [Leptotrombidium deliense]
MENSENGTKKEQTPESNVLEANGARRPKKYSADVEGVFEIEGLDTSQQRAFEESEDDHVSADSADEGLPANVIRNAGVKHYATSLPIKVPFWTVNHEDKSDDEKISSFEGPDRIPESIKALAKSVRDSTEMFGDLPRRRLNTGDLVKSRPI